jgi:hypothetical protein
MRSVAPDVHRLSVSLLGIVRTVFEIAIARDGDAADPGLAAVAGGSVAERVAVHARHH